MKIRCNRSDMPNEYTYVGAEQYKDCIYIVTRFEPNMRQDAIIDSKAGRVLYPAAVQEAVGGFLNISPDDVKHIEVSLDTRCLTMTREEWVARTKKEQDR